MKKLVSERELILKLMQARPDWSRDQAMTFIEERVRAGLMTPCEDFTEEDRPTYRLWSRLQ